MPGFLHLTETFRNCIYRGSIRSILFGVPSACSFEHAVGTDMDEPCLNILRLSPQVMREKAIHVVSPNFVTLRELIENPHCINNAMRGNDIDQLLNSGYIVRIYIQPAKIALIPGCMEDVMLALAAKIIRQHMPRHTVSTKDKQLHCRNPPRIRMLLISS
ncbi:hypothetical protein D3C76_1245010 [compost metagenome]